MIGGALLFIEQDWSLSPFLKGLIPAATPLGAAFGALYGGWSLDTFGRKPTIMKACVVFTLGAVLMAFAPEVTVLTIGRFVVGVGVGLVSMAVPVYLSESAPERFRGAIATLNVLFITTGQFISYVVDLALFNVPNYQWRWMLGISAVPAVLQFVGMLFLLETPRWLISKGMLGEAKRALTVIGGDPAAAARDLRDICVAVKSEPRGSVYELFSDSTNRRALLIACGLLILQQVCAINTVMYYVPQILQASGICANLQGSECDKTVLLWSLLPAGTNSLGTVVGMLLVDRAGRRGLLLGSIAGVILALLGMGLTSIYASQHLVWAVVAYLICFSPGLGPVPWAVAAEIFPIKVRGLGMSVATASNWLANFIISVTFPLLTESIGLSNAMFGYMAFATFTFVFVYFLLPETKGLTLEEVTALLRENHEPVPFWKKVATKKKKDKAAQTLLRNTSVQRD